MKIKSIITAGMLTIAVAIAMIPGKSWAGSPQSYRWQGVAIGVGAAIIGTALVKAYQDANQAAYEPAVHHHRHPPVPAGHWEIQQEWVPPVFEKRWNPGHYNPRGRWIAGHWIQIETQAGYWTEKRVWVPAQ